LDLEGSGAASLVSEREKVNWDSLAQQAADKLRKTDSSRAEARSE